MRVAVLFRGPLRPTPADTRRYIGGLLSHFSDIGIEPARYLATWHPAEVSADIAALFENDVDNVVLLAMPPARLMGDDVWNGMLPSGHRARNMFYQYYVSKIAIDAMIAHDEYDLIVHARTDMNIDFGGRFGEWFEADRVGHYQALHIRDPHPLSYINDQFAVARPHLMKAAWDYRDLPNLRAKIMAVVRAGGKGEDVLQAIMDDAGVEAIGGPATGYALDADRHRNGL